uniref:Uncharacterized protein n=1 Tax=Arundo donax TaxID=35708 RepID=A0A0A9CPR8_ARUDO
MLDGEDVRLRSLLGKEGKPRVLGFVSIFGNFVYWKRV